MPPGRGSEKFSYLLPSSSRMCFLLRTEKGYQLYEPQGRSGDPAALLEDKILPNRWSGLTSQYRDWSFHTGHLYESKSNRSKKLQLTHFLGLRHWYQEWPATKRSTSQQCQRPQGRPDGFTTWSKEAWSGDQRLSNVRRSCRKTWFTLEQCLVGDYRVPSTGSGVGGMPGKEEAVLVLKEAMGHWGSTTKKWKSHFYAGASKRHQEETPVQWEKVEAISWATSQSRPDCPRSKQRLRLGG